MYRRNGGMGRGVVGGGGWGILGPDPLVREGVSRPIFVESWDRLGVWSPMGQRLLGWTGFQFAAGLVQKGLGGGQHSPPPPPISLAHGPSSGKQAGGKRHVGGAGTQDRGPPPVPRYSRGKLNTGGQKIMAKEVD